MSWCSVFSGPRASSKISNKVLEEEAHFVLPIVMSVIKGLMICCWFIMLPNNGMDATVFPSKTVSVGTSRAVPNTVYLHLSPKAQGQFIDSGQL